MISLMKIIIIISNQRLYNHLLTRLPAKPKSGMTSPEVKTRKRRVTKGAGECGFQQDEVGLGNRVHFKSSNDYKRNGEEYG